MPLMLDVMRKHSKSFLIYVLFGIIIVVFIISFGPGDCSRPMGTGEHTAAEINGKRIPITEFENIYNFDPRYQFKDRREDTAENRQAAMDALVEREIMAQEAERLGVRIGDADLAKRIRRIKWLHKDGKFNMDYYKRWVQYMNSSVPVFEQRLRKDFLGDDLRGMVLTAVQVSDGEVDAEWRTRNTKVNLEYAEFAATAQKDAVAVTPEEVKAWKEANRKKIEDHWNQKKFLYFARKQYKVRQIALRVPAGADKAARDQVQKRLEELKKEIDGGKDFAEVAKLSSQDEATKDKGGEMGLLERKEMPSPEFRKAATDTPVGKASAPFCEKEWCRIVKVDSTRERELKELEDDIAADLLKDEKTLATARREAEALLAKLKADKKADMKALAPKKKAPQTAEEKKKAAEKKERQRKMREALAKAFAKNPGMKAELPPDEDDKGPYGETGLFARQRNFLVPKIGISKELMKAAFQLKERGEVAPQVFEVDKKLYVVRLKEREEPKEAKAEDLDAIRKELTLVKQARVYEAWLDALRKRAKIAINTRVIKPPAVKRTGDEKDSPPAAPAKGKKG